MDRMTKEIRELLHLSKAVVKGVHEGVYVQMMFRCLSLCVCVRVNALTLC